MQKIANKVALCILVVCTVIFFYPFFLKGQIPLPGDILLGAYHPWAELPWGDRVTAYPYKVFEMNDSINFDYPIKLEIVRQIKDFRLPIWNKYILNGTPLSGDGHSGAFYPLNALLLLGDFNFGWSIFIMVQPLLASFFLFLYLRHLKISAVASFFGGLSFGFSSYFINQTELATIGHTIIWLPLLLLGIDYFHENRKIANLIIPVSATMMFLAGFLQLFIYAVLLATTYFFVGGRVTARKISAASAMVLLFISLSAVQLLPFLNFLPDTVRWHGSGVEVSVTEWLVSPKLLLLILSPDYFGNPATGNWIGGYAYFEFIAYIGPFLLPLLYFSLRSKQKMSKFFLWTLVVSLVVTVRNPISLFLYGSGFPILSSFTPSRMLMIFVLAASILVSFGADEFQKAKKTEKLLAFIFFMLLLIAIWILTGNKHMILPIAFSLAGIASFIIIKQNKYTIIALTVITGVSLFYQAHKYLPFTPGNLIFPETNVIRFLKKNLDGYRFMSIHTETMPVSSNMVYQLSSPNGYNPVHDFVYNRFTSKLQFESDSTYFGKTVFLTRVNRETLDFTNVKYVVNLGDITNPEVLPLLKKVLVEGKTVVYEVSTPSAKISENLPSIYWEQQKWTKIGLAITVIGVIIVFVVWEKSKYEN